VLGNAAPDVLLDTRQPPKNELQVVFKLCPDKGYAADCGVMLHLDRIEVMHLSL
jgi:hypothetical protein